MVTVDVVVPKDLTDEAKVALAAYADAHPVNPRTHLEAAVTDHG
jgi:hypothetical protein